MIFDTYDNLYYGRQHFEKRSTLYDKENIEYKINYDTVLELGCHDGKVIEFLPKMPSIYKGYDANWENGIELARKRFSKNQYCSFVL